MLVVAVPFHGINHLTAGTMMQLDCLGSVVDMLADTRLDVWHT